MTKTPHINIINADAIDKYLGDFVGHEHGYFVEVKLLLVQAVKRHLQNDARIATALETPPTDAPAWLVNKWDTCGPFHRFDAAKADATPNLRNEITHIRDWLLSAKQTGAEFLDDKINGKPKTLLHIQSISHAYDLADKYFVELNKRIEANPDVEGVDVKTIMTFKDGYRFVQLLTPNALKNEGPKAGHCIGGGAYDSKMAHGHIYYSLRDADNKPHATLETRSEFFGNKSLKQCRGKENKQPIDKYLPYVQKFVRTQKISLSTSANRSDYIGYLVNENMPYLDLLNPPQKAVRDKLHIEIEHFMGGARLPRVLHSHKDADDAFFHFDMGAALVNKAQEHLLPKKPFVLPDVVHCHKGTVKISNCASVGGYPIVMPKYLTAQTLILDNVMGMDAFPNTYKVEKVIIKGATQMIDKIPPHIAMDIELTATSTPLPTGRIYERVKVENEKVLAALPAGLHIKTLDIGNLSFRNRTQIPAHIIVDEVIFSLGTPFSACGEKIVTDQQKTTAFLDMFNSHAARLPKSDFEIGLHIRDKSRLFRQAVILITRAAKELSPQIKPAPKDDFMMI